MKPFEIPHLQIVYFGERDVLTSSNCPCVECPDGCEPGSFNCECVDFDTNAIPGPETF